MFSVDNFYEIFDSYYGRDKTEISMWYFRPYGSKDFVDLIIWYHTPERTLKELDQIRTSGSIILHDQEPFSIDAIDTYKGFLSQVTNSPMWDNMTRGELIQMMPSIFGAYNNIFCHSEKDSDDIALLKKEGMIDCYYFWHGFIARDWFRHWRHHADISATKCWQQRFLMYARDFTGTRQYRKELISKLSNLQGRIRYNWQGNSPKHSDFSAKIDVIDAAQTAIQIVPETVFDRTKIHATEKIFKPIVMKQPFIVVAGSGTLEYLKSYGFRTFDSIWDESYDSEKDHHARLSKIVSLVGNLSDKSNKEFNSILSRCQEIVEYNHHHFFSDSFEKKLLDEMHSNILSSIDMQKRLKKENPGGGFYSSLDRMFRENLEISPYVMDILKSSSRYLRDTQQDRYQDILLRYPWVNRVVG